MSISKLALTALSFYVFSNFLQAQVYINKEWVSAHGQPDSIEWSASTTDLSGHLITTGNTLVPGQQADILTIKYEENGNISWQRSWDSPNSQSDYGAAIITDANDNVYIAGASQYSDSLFDIVIIKYNSQGAQQWEVNYDGTGGKDFPVKMTIDQVGFVYVTGASEGSGSDFDFITLKYEMTNGGLLWDARYDFNMGVDIAADIVTEPGGDNVTITGGSEVSGGVWEYTTVQYDINGVQTGVDREPSDEADLRKPKDIVKDASQNYYITGVYDNGADNDVKLIKLDSTLNTQWVQVYNQGNEGSNALAIDISGNIYIGGWQEDIAGSGNKHFLLLKYHSSGNLIWEQTYYPEDNKPIAEITDIEIEDNEMVNVIGYATDGFDADIITARFSMNTGELDWSKTWSGVGVSIDHPTSIKQVDNDIYVSGRVDNPSSSKWVTIKYSYFEPSQAIVFDQNDKPLYAKNQLIVRFDPSKVKVPAVDNMNGKVAEFGSLDYFLMQDVVDSIQNKMTAFCEGECPIVMLKIFKELKTTDDTTVSRLGHQIEVPEFWSAFILEFSEGVDINDIGDSLETLFPMIRYTHPNVIVEQAAPPNDWYYNNGYQASLHNISPYGNAHINVEQAWDTYNAHGSPSVKVGVFDDGLAWKHEDFGYVAGNPSSSKIIAGWDFISGTSLKTHPNGFGEHGTPVAGIIGAIRNNSIGIAGIAGGNTTAGDGVSLYGLRIFKEFGLSSYQNQVSNAVDAIVEGAKSPASSYSYGLDIMNHSWGFQEGNYPSGVELLTEAVHFANRAGVTFVASVGNEGLNGNGFHARYPAITDEDWVICVGGTGNDGNYLNGSNGGNLATSKSFLIDVAAPASPDIVWSTTKYSTPNAYAAFQLSSAAAPHVTGTAAILLSYLTEPNSPSDRPSPDDVEQILERTSSSGMIGLTGHGRINAGYAIGYVNKAYRKLKHYELDTKELVISLHSRNQSVALQEFYENPQNIPFKAGAYVVDIYKVEGLVTHSIPANEILIAGWGRSSSSNLFGLPSTSNEFKARERVDFTPVLATGTFTLKGYIYKVFDNSTGVHLGWWPFDINSGKELMAYTLIHEDQNYFEVSELSTGNDYLNLYPNPTSGKQRLEVYTEIPMDMQIDLYDMAGRKVLSVFSGTSVQGQQDFEVDLNRLTAGIYIYQLQVGDRHEYIKVIKE